ncbi:hypothetical protein DSC45_00900 [Streptomyces sp. YIM 130001]|uniref:tpaE n=1 Tax=Streptomyces sp. YIM 130001 TaxID=2259644 RepID=UPI000E65AD54|nr:tpaE [Streptomyces sp. YIM 130001]RII22268.1 hypothetical protein DSC45_00900 [Streptomyces sp. YIM 130001]
MAAEMKAEQIGRAARTDMQLTVPVRPVLRRGVRLRRAGDAVVLDGADRKQAFSGAFAREGLVPLTEACDGTRGHAELALELGMDEAAVYKCLALLRTAGAIEEAPGGEEPKVAAEWAVLLSRLGNSTGANASWADAVTRLDRRAVRLEGDRELVSSARRILDGVFRTDRDPGGASDELTVFFETAASAPQLADVEQRCRESGQPLLRIRADATTVVIGPYVDPAITPCLGCGRHGEPGPPGEHPGRLDDLVVGLASHHIAALLTRTTITQLPIDSVVIDAATLSTTYRPAAVRPGCPRCSAARGPVAPEPPAGAVYEASVAIPPRTFLSPRDHQAHYHSGNLRLQSQFKDWPSRTHTPLPEPDVGRLAGPGRSAARTSGSGGDVPLTLDTLGLVLKTAFGIRDDRTTPSNVKRWTAAAGNIGCTTAYVVVRDGQVLPPGVYAYAQADHSLALVSGEVPSGNAPCDIVITGDLRKIMTKYGTFGLRLVFLDAGCSLTTAREVTGHLGVAFAPHTDWDDEALSAMLGISPADEPIAAVASLGGTA